jgi:formate hydrogenlyase transcriptional activator
MTESGKSTNDLPPEDSIPDGAVSLESILCTEELRRRAWRPPDYRAENRALIVLAGTLTESPRTILQTLAETILEVTRSDSAGVSLLTTHDGGKRFYWPAIAGIWKPHVGGGTPRNFGPCGDVLDRNATLLFRHLELRYTYFLPVTPPPVETLLVPFYVGGKAVGTIWSLMHDDSRKFDAEDERLMGVLGKFASLGYQTLASLDDLELQLTARDKAETVVRELTVGLETQVRVRTEELERRNHYLRRVLDTTPALIHTARPDGYLDYFNQRWLEYLGVCLDDICGWKWTNSIHPEDVEEILQKWHSALATGEPFEAETRVRRADGEYRRLLHRKFPLRDQEGKILQWFGSSIDIEDRRQADDDLRSAFDEIKKLKDQLHKENIALREEIDKASMFEEIVGASPQLQLVLSQISKVAPTDSTVLITGETGTGKELVARAIHRRSDRASHAFVSVNCAAIPRDLVASELFGHEKGAFTGALQRRLGRFELAEGGTIFLDEVGDLPAETQVALLRVLQEHEFERVGGTRPMQANVRVIAATNRDLQAAVAAGALRKDLFYRLNVFPIEVPPLRERRDDIPMLVEYFVDRYARKAGRKIKQIEKKTLGLLQTYSWPGNIRELQNVLERSVIVSDTEYLTIDESWLSPEPSHALRASQPLAKVSVAQETETIEKALAESRGRVSGAVGAAAKLGIPASTLESRIRSLGINKYIFKTR